MRDQEGEEIDLVVLAGFMHVLSAEFLDVLSGLRPYSSSSSSSPSSVPRAIPIINLHPALPGTFDGAHAIERAYEAFEKREITKTGVMVHRVIKEVDRGEPVAVREIEIREGESLEQLEDRIHDVEHEIIVEAVVKILSEGNAI